MKASELLDGELDDETLRAFELHLEKCADCGPWVATLRETVSMLRGLEHEPVPEHLAQRIRDITIGKE